MEQVVRRNVYTQSPKANFFGVKDFKSSRTRWDKDEKSLYLKINRFGHAMDPERGMLAFYGSACKTKCSMIFSAESSTWFNAVPKENEIRDYIRQNGLKTAFDYLHLFSLASGLFRFKEFKEIVESFRNQSKNLIEIDLTELIKLYFPKFNKALKTIFFYSNVWQIRDTKGNIILDLHWQKVADAFDFSDFPFVTSLEPYTDMRISS